MGGAKKVFKKVQKLWKSVSKLIKGITDVLNKALKGVVNILKKALDAVMGFLGFKDEEVITVAANTQPMWEEEFAWRFKDDIILKGVVQDLGFVELMRDIIIGGQHNNFRRYFKYGRNDYYLGLPKVTYGAGKAFEVNKLKMQLWSEHIEKYGLPNDITEVDKLPVADDTFEVETPNIRQLVFNDVATKYGYNEKDGKLEINGVRYDVEWYTLNTNSRVIEKNDPNDTWDLIETQYTVRLTNIDKYFPVNSPVFNRETLSIEFPYNFWGYGYIARYTDDVGESVEVKIPMGSIVPWDNEMDGTILVANTKSALFGEAVEWEVRLLNKPEPDTYMKGDFVPLVEISVIKREEDSSHTRPIRDISGTIYDTHGRYIVFSFKVTNARYTPFPDNLSHKFDYRKKVPYAGDTEFTGNGADNPTQEISDFSDVMPVILFKNEGRWIDTDKKSEEYITSRKLMKTVGLNLQELLDSIRDSDGGSASNVTTMAVRMGVDLLNNDQNCMKYCYNYFDYLFHNALVSENDYTKSSNSGRGTDFNIFAIQEGSFNAAYSLNFVRKTVERGITGPHANKKDYYERVLSGSNCTLYKYIGNGVREKLYISELTGYYSIHVPKAKKSKVAVMSFVKSEDPDLTPNFVLPMLNGLLRSLTPLEREAVVTRSNYLTVFSADYQKIKWYKTKRFMKIIGIVIAIVVAVLTWNPQAGASVAAAWSAGAYAFAQFVLTKFVIAYMSTKLLQIVMEKLIGLFGDSAWGTILAIAAAAVAAYYGGKMINTPIEINDAILHTTRVGAQAYSNRIQGALAEIANEFDSMMSQYEDAYKANQQVLEEMAPKNPVNILALIVDTPDKFFVKADMDTTEVLLEERLFLPSTDHDHVFA